jgi:rare lipoprotein A (peptidoglycan hydrolase)
MSPHDSPTFYPSFGMRRTQGAKLFNLGDSYCFCVRLLRLKVETLQKLLKFGRVLVRLTPCVVAGGLAACSQMEAGSLGMSSVELKSQDPAYGGAYNYGAAANVSASGSQNISASVIPSAYQAPGDATGATVASASGQATAPAAGAAPKLTRSLYIPERLKEPAPSAAGPYKIGAPYTVGGKLYTPKHERNYSKVGLASWYGPDFHGHVTANGEVYNMHGLSAAHQTLPLPCYARVTNVKNGRSVIVRVNDRGPFKPNRIVDLSSRAADLLGFHKSGVAPVRVEYVGLAPLAEGVRNRPATSNRPWMAQYADAARGPASDSAPAVAQHSGAVSH